MRYETQQKLMNAIQIIRERKEISYKELAPLIGMAPNTLSQYSYFIIFNDPCIEYHRGIFKFKENCIEGEGHGGQQVGRNR